ncbi:MAG: thiamine pyrophosphate-dependent enzyme [Bacteroidota bacterium]
MNKAETEKISLDQFKASIISDYTIAYRSRQASLLGRKEVLTGKAKFGIFGDGKELPQIAMSKFFKAGDFRSGYYRDQTFMMAAGLHTVQEFFAQLYAHTDVNAEPASAGRMMNGHFATRTIDENGMWRDLKNLKNSSADISPTAGQMPRLVGLAYASKYYRNNKDILGENIFSENGNEIAWGTIGNASTSEGHFFEAINAVGVLQVPMIISVWDDDYGISVPAKYQTTKQNISEILKGFQRDEKGEGYNIYVVNGWDYPELIRVYDEASRIAREQHIPAIVHVRELTQPQGHSTSGSHERYKTKERLEWEKDHDCMTRFRQWIIDRGFSTLEEIEAIEVEEKKFVADSKSAAWEAYINPIKNDVEEVSQLLADLASSSSKANEINEKIEQLKKFNEPTRREVSEAFGAGLRLTIGEESDARHNLIRYKENFEILNFDRYSSYLYSHSKDSVMNVEEIKPVYSENSKLVDGREILQACFDEMFKRDPRVLAFGEDVGRIGDVNQGFAGLQEKHGENRIFDTGIRELTIIGQGIGAALRGLRPIAEIQYLDYLLYGLQPLSDDLATLQHRTKGGQKAPLIIRTRGHRLEGVWHAGSPIAMTLHTLRGINIIAPRNMTKAAGFYNTLLKCDEPALVIECLNGYRLKEKLPDNIGEYTVPIGVPEVICEGNDVTVVSYGSTLRVAEDAAKLLLGIGISCELIDAQTLMPFDVHHSIVESLKKTNKIVFVDEDVSGGATAYMMHKVLEEQDGFKFLDAKPMTISSRDHRPAYGSDGDFFSKPSAESIFEKIASLMNEYDPIRFPKFD